MAAAMTQTLAKPKSSVPVTIEQALVQGDLSQLDPEQRVNYYLRVCESLGLNPYTKPFDYLLLNGRLVLYARKDATDQLRKLHKVNITAVDHKQIGELLVVTVSATTPDGRRDTATGAVAVGGLKGDLLANALMKAETKAKRRCTLSLCGLGMTDESEVDSIPDVEFPTNAEAYVPTDTREVDDRDLVRAPTDRYWLRWLDLVVDAQAVALSPPRLELPIERAELKRRGTELATAISERQEQLDKDVAAV